MDHIDHLLQDQNNAALGVRTRERQELPSDDKVRLKVAQQLNDAVALYGRHFTRAETVQKLQRQIEIIQKRAGI